MVVSLIVEAYRFVKRCQIEPPESFGWNLGAPGDTPLSPEEYDEEYRKKEARKREYFEREAEKASQLELAMAMREEEDAEEWTDAELAKMKEEEENRPLEDWEKEELEKIKAEIRREE